MQYRDNYYIYENLHDHLNIFQKGFFSYLTILVLSKIDTCKKYDFADWNDLSKNGFKGVSKFLEYPVSDRFAIWIKQWNVKITTIG